MCTFYHLEWIVNGSTHRSLSEGRVTRSGRWVCMGDPRSKNGDHADLESAHWMRFLCIRHL